MPDILSCTGKALRVWGVGSEERNVACWDIFLTVHYEGASVLFSQIKITKPYIDMLCKSLSSDCLSFVMHTCGV